MLCRTSLGFKQYKVGLPPFLFDLDLDNYFLSLDFYESFFSCVQQVESSLYEDEEINMGWTG